MPTAASSLQAPAPALQRTTTVASSAVISIRSLSLDPAKTEHHDKAARKRMRKSLEAAPSAAAAPTTAHSDIEAQTRHPAPTMTRRTSSIEPPITDKASLAAWRQWAASEVVTHAALVHPHRNVEVAGVAGTIPQRLPLCCSARELMTATNVGVRLYFDTLRFFVGFALLGLVCHAPSIAASIMYVGHVAGSHTQPEVHFA